MTPEIGKRIAALRKARGWTQEDLAGRIDSVREYVAQLETGTRRPGVDTLIKLRDAFGLASIDALIADAPSAEAAEVA